MGNEKNLNFKDAEFEEFNEPFVPPVVSGGKKDNESKKAEATLDEDLGNLSGDKVVDEEAETVEAETVNSSEPPPTMIISGVMFMHLLNIAVPGIIEICFEQIKYLKKNYNFDKEALTLEKDEQEMLAPGAEYVADFLFKKLHPIAQFFIGLGVIYLSKIPQAFEKKPKE